MKVREEIRRIIMALLVKAPFFSLMLRSIPIYASKETKLLRVGKSYIIINPEAFLDLEKNDKIYLLLHAITHIILFHPYRIEELHKKYRIPIKILNFFAENIVDNKIRGLIHTKRLIPYYPIEDPALPENIYSWSLEEIARFLYRLEKKRMKSIQRKIEEQEPINIFTRIPLPDIEFDEPIPTRDIDIVNEGSEKLDPNAPADLIKNALIRAIVDAYMTAKQAGNIPGWVERLVNNLLEPQINWRALLRYGLRQNLGKRIRRTYSRPNKKYIISNYYLFPSKRTYGGAKALILVDTSGSISDEDLNAFFSEIYGIFKYGGAKDIIVIPWDVKPHKPVHIKNMNDFEKIKITGKGGTKLTPAIEEALKLVDHQTIVIIFSDFEITELYDTKMLNKLKNLMLELSKKSLKAIMVTNYRELRVPRWDIIVLRRRKK